MGIVYIAINTLDNDKPYIGKSIDTLTMRKIKHRYDVKHGSRPVSSIGALNMSFENYAAKQSGIQRGTNLLHRIRQIYSIGKDVQTLMTDYQAATDPAMNATINALLTAGERTEIGAMLSNIDQLVTAWEQNHAAALGVS